LRFCKDLLDEFLRRIRVSLYYNPPTMRRNCIALQAIIIQKTVAWLR